VRHKKPRSVWLHRPGRHIEPWKGSSMQVEATRMYRVREVAGHFEVSVATIYRAIESGQLAALKLSEGTGTLRVPGSAVLAYAAACAPGTGAVVDGAAR